MDENEKMVSATDDKQSQNTVAEWVYQQKQANKED